MGNGNNLRNQQHDKRSHVPIRAGPRYIFRTTSAGDERNINNMLLVPDLKLTCSLERAIFVCRACEFCLLGVGTLSPPPPPPDKLYESLYLLLQDFARALCSRSRNGSFSFPKNGYQYECSLASNHTRVCSWEGRERAYEGKIDVA